jgi:metal transporter CNNM
LHDDEISILSGVLELGNKRADTIMTPLKDVVTISADDVLDHQKLEFLLMSGFSRFPVHEPGRPLAFVGLLLVKKLLTCDLTKPLKVSDVSLSILPEAGPSINCFQALDYFQTGRAHLLLLSRTPGVAGGALGVITLEDIIEEIISEEIVDETDRYEDNRHKQRAKRMTTAAVMRGIVEISVRGRRGESVSTVGSPTRFESTPLVTGNSPGGGKTSQYGSFISESPKA